MYNFDCASFTYIASLNLHSSPLESLLLLNFVDEEMKLRQVK